MLQFDELENITNGKAMQLFYNSPITELLTDSRNATVHNGVLFFAIAGTRNDGHKYIEALYDKGIRQFVVERKIDTKAFPDANFLQVTNSIKALQDIATYHRNELALPTIGITGSNGKTIVKEWLFQLLSKYKKIVKTPQSYNSQIGVPLSVWKASVNDELGIFEAGISQTGEMNKLAMVIQPQTGIFTNIGPAHDEGFSNKKEKVKEKAKLFKSSQKIIYCKDHSKIDVELAQFKAKLFTWGKHAEATIHIKNIAVIGAGSTITLQFKKKLFPLTFPFTDDASIENAMHCVTYMLSEGFSPKKIQEGLDGLKGIKMRLELKEGINRCYIIDDSYNNDLSGLSVALDFLNQQQQNPQKTLILSDILQSGMDEQKLYSEVSSIILQKGIDKLIGIGASISKYQKLFKTESHFYADTQKFLKDFKTTDYQEEMILVKGARIFGFEKVVNKLQQKIHGTVLEINLNALVNNLNFYKSRLKAKTSVMAMVKAFAYGSGSHEVAHLLQFHKVDYLAVAYPDEGVSLRKHGITLPIMVMNAQEDSFDALLNYNLEPEIYSSKMLQAFSTYLNGKNAKVHIKIDTGMRRLGISPTELAELTELLVQNSNIEIASIFSHLAGADESLHNDFSARQAEQFEVACEHLEAQLKINPLRHLLNSAGILRFPEYHYDMVRLGVGLYGIDANKLYQEKLENISTLKTVISQIKEVAKGESVGYGRMGIAKQNIKIATIAIGYADGFSRIFGNGNTHVVINGQKAQTIGNVCMDMTMVDITGIDATEGDEVIIFGKEIPIPLLAEKAKTIPYEILTSISERVKRVFYKE